MSRIPRTKYRRDFGRQGVPLHLDKDAPPLEETRVFTKKDGPRHVCNACQRVFQAGETGRETRPHAYRHLKCPKPTQAELQPGEEWRLIEGKGWRRWRPIAT